MYYLLITTSRSTWGFNQRPVACIGLPNLFSTLNVKYSEYEAKWSRTRDCW